MTKLPVGQMNVLFTKVKPGKAEGVVTRRIKSRALPSDPKEVFNNPVVCITLRKKI